MKQWLEGDERGQNDGTGERTAGERGQKDGAGERAAGERGQKDGASERAAGERGHKSDGGPRDNKKEDHKKTDRVVVVHCKAGKGRSGTMACSYLIAECGWTPQQALDRFTERRMRPKFGNGVTIPSQLRWVGYVDRWTRHGKPTYVDRPVEIVEIHFRGLRHGVKLAVEGYVDEGKQIHVFHTFKNGERYVVEGDAPGGGGLVDLMSDMAGAFGGGGNNNNNGSKGISTQNSSRSNSSTFDRPDLQAGKIRRPKTDFQVGNDNNSKNSSSYPSLITNNDPSLSVDIEQLQGKSESTPALDAKGTSATSSTTASQAQTQNQKQQPFRYAAHDEPGGQAVIFKPQQPIRVPNSDVNISIERRNKTTASMGLTMVTSVAHVWFNTFFEGNGPEQNGRPDDSGVFVLDWDKLDGIKGSSQKGSRAAEQISVVWRHVTEEGEKTGTGKGPDAVGATKEDAAQDLSTGADVPQMRPADWAGNNGGDPDANKHLGLRREDPDSAGVSRASSVTGIPVSDSSGSHAANTLSHGADASKERDKEHEEVLASVKASGPEGEATLDESVASEGQAARTS